MYNKIFTKILDSSIWLETDSTRIVWLTLIAAMDETGFTQFASPANLAHRARVPLESAESAISLLEGPDTNSSDPEHEGRRIERVPGGWMVLNSAKYREMVTRAVSQEKTRERVARFRAKNKGVTMGNDSVTPSNVPVTPSEADTESEAASFRITPEDIYACYPRRVGRDDALKAIARALKSIPAAILQEKTKDYFEAMMLWPAHDRQFIPYPATWFNRGSYNDDPREWACKPSAGGNQKKAGFA